MSSNKNHNTGAIPEGYVLITTGPNQKQYVVPEFMVSSLHQTFDGYRKKLDLKAYGHAGCVSIIFSFRSSTAELLALIAGLLIRSINSTVTHSVSFPKVKSWPRLSL
jgi:hypothetical protein